MVQRAEALDSEEIFESIAVETDEDFKPLDPPRTSTFVPEPVPLLLQPLRLPQRESKKCPFCAETIAAEAIKCRFCGSMLVPLPNESRHLQDPNLILPKAIPESPVLMAILSGCVIAGAGQMVMGQVAKGVVFLLGALVLAVLTAGISIFFTWPLMGIDAYLVAKKLNAGEPVTRWECFPIS